MIAIFKKISCIVSEKKRCQFNNNIELTVINLNIFALDIGSQMTKKKVRKKYFIIIIFDKDIGLLSRFLLL